MKTKLTIKTMGPLWAGATAMLISFNALTLQAEKGGGKGGGGDDGGDGGGGGGIPTFVARIVFRDDPADGVRSDVGAPDSAVPERCEDLYAYWDNHDSGLTCSGPARADVSGGGRLKFSTTKYLDDTPTPRWVVLDFSRLIEVMTTDPDFDPENPDVDQVYEGIYGDPPYEATLGLDHVNIHMSMDTIFDTTPPATVPVGFGVTKFFPNSDGSDTGSEGPSGYRVIWEHELFLDSPAEDVRILSTEKDGEDRSVAILYKRVQIRRNKWDWVPMAKYEMPFSWELEKVAP